MTTRQKKPVIFLAFANDKTDNTRYLRNLSLELTGIRKALEPALEENLCEIIERSNASIDDILDIFENRNYCDRIAIFHYGGHADGYQLLLENADGSQSIAHGEGLVSYLQKRNHLKIIFLNGCSTEQQAIDLMNRGISCVIATTQTIDDMTASDLATRFYKSLARGFSIEKSWDEATDEIKIRKGVNYRALYRRRPDLITPDRFPWRIYFRKGSGIIREWNLPDASENPLFGLPEIPQNYTLPENPYLFLKQYERKHAKIFFGRSFYIRALYNRIADRKAPPIIQFYGQSGVGKSSLLDAGLFPRLEKEYTVIYAKRKQNLGLSQTLRAALEQLAPASETEGKNQRSERLEKIDTDISNLRKVQNELRGEAIEKIAKLIWELDEKRKRLRDNRLENLTENASSIQVAWLRAEIFTGKPVVILLDQVEEIFTRPNDQFDSEMTDFALQLREIFGNPKQLPQGKLILSYRKEFHPEIREALRSQELSRTDIFLEHLTHQDIAEVVKGMALSDELKNRYGIRVDTDLSHLIADDLVADKNSPIAAVLQIILTRMWEKNAENRRQGKPTIFTVEMYRELKRKGLAMSEFFDRQILIVRNSFPEAVDSGLVLDILKQHTTEMLAAESMPTQTLQKLYRHQATILEKLVQKLKEVYLLNDSETEPHATVLIHDTLAPVVIREFNESDRAGQHASRLLTAKQPDSTEETQEIWLDIPDLKAVEKGMTGMRDLTEIERKILVRSQKRRNRKRTEKYSLWTVLGLLAGAVFVLAILFNFQRDKARKEALANRLTAQALELQETDATDALRIAEKALKINPESAGVWKILGKIYAENIFHQKTFWHKKAVRAVAFSPNGKYVLIGTEGNSAKLWNLEGKEIHIFRGHSDRISAVAFSPDGSKIITGSRDRTAILRNIQGDTLRTLRGHSGEITSIQFSPDGTKIITASTDNSAKIWTQHGDFQQDLIGHPFIITSACFASDGKKILTADFGGTIISWDENGNGQTIFQNPELNIFSIDVSSDGSKILVGSSEKFAFIFDRNTQKIIRFKAHQSAVHAVKFSPDGKYVLSGSNDHTVILSDAQTGEIQFEFKGHGQEINTLTFSENGKYILTGCEDGTSKLIHIQGITMNNFSFEYPIVGVDFASQKSNLMAIGLKNGEIFTLQNHEKIQAHFRHPEGILSLKFAPKNDQLLTAGNDRTARLWDAKTGRLLRQFKGHKARIYAVDYSADGTKILTASDDHTLKIWNAKNGKLLQTFDEKNDRMHTAQFFPNHHQIVSGSWRGILKIRKLQGHEVFNQSVHDGKINAISVSADGTKILSGGDDQTALLFDAKGRKLLTLALPKAVLSVAFSPDGKYLLTGCADNTATLWNLAGNPIFRFRAHDAAIQTVGFSPDGKLMFTGSDDKSVRLTFTPDAFLKSGKADRLSLANLLEIEPQIDYQDLLKKSNSEFLREAAYFFERKALQEADYEQQISDFKTSVQFYEKLIETTRSQYDTEEAAEAYAELAETELYLGKFTACLSHAQKAYAYAEQTTDLQRIMLLKILVHLQNYATDSARKELEAIPQIESTKFFDQWHTLNQKLMTSNLNINHQQIVDFEGFILEKWQGSTPSALEKYALYFREKLKVLGRTDYAVRLRYQQNYLSLQKQFLRHKTKVSTADSLVLAEGYLEQSYYQLFVLDRQNSQKSLEMALKLHSNILEQTQPYQRIKAGFVYLYTDNYEQAQKIFEEGKPVFTKVIYEILAELEALGLRHPDALKIKKLIQMKD